MTDIDLFATVDPRDLFYTILGLAFLGLTLQPALAKIRIVNVPLLYVLVGMGLAWAGLPVIDPLDGGLSAKIVEHAAELIVIVSLSGAGLAIDTPASWRNWQATWRLLIVAMPLTIATIAILGATMGGLSLAGALLLAAALAPTDPVLARSVQVGAPGQEETEMEVALTAEAGLNDGLAFPFVYLAISVAAYGWASGAWEGWIWSWISFDTVYRVGAGIVMGWLIGSAITRLVYSPLGDASHGGWNSMIVVLGATLLSYGATEAVDGYGFLAVFVAARAGRAYSRGGGREDYEKYVHHGADQIEQLLLAILLLWFGMFVASGGIAGAGWTDWLIGAIIIFAARPVFGFLSLVGVECGALARRKVAFFGIRGMGTIFYIAYAQNHADFADIDAVWRIAAITIMISVVVHGFASNFLLSEEEEEIHPYKEKAEAGRE